MQARHEIANRKTRLDIAVRLSEYGFGTAVERGQIHAALR